MDRIRVAFAGLAALAVAMGIGRFAFTPLLPMMQDDAGVSLAQGGYLASANYLGYLAGALSSQPWLALGGVCLGVTAFVWRMVGEGPARKASARFIWTADRARLVICYGAFGFGYIIPATFVPAMAKTIIDDPAVFGWA